MKAIRVKEYGDPEVLILEDVKEPLPGAKQVLVRMKASGINFIDIYRRRGQYPTELPYTPGQEGSGIVDTIGEGVANFKQGDRVAYTGPLGAYAELALVPADSLIPLPDDFSFEQGAAFPLQGMTAHYLLHEYRLPKPGDCVLIHAAAGGMGLLLVQWAKHLGARVFGTVSTEEKAQIARDAGADEIIFYNRQDFVAEVKRLTSGMGVELIIDGVGKTTFTGNLEACAIRGQIVIYGAASGPADPIAPNALQSRSLTVSGGTLFNYLITREELLNRAREVIEGIRQGWLRLRCENVLPLSHAAEAHRLLEGRQSTGKIVLNVS